METHFVECSMLYFKHGFGFHSLLSIGLKTPMLTASFEIQSKWLFATLDMEEARYSFCVGL